MTVHTLGIWRVRPGHEEAFVQAWRAMAEQTKASFPEASAQLLQDRDTPTLFVSSGPWESPEQVQEWRSSAAFTDGVAAIKASLEGFEPHTMDPVVTVERSPDVQPEGVRRR